MTDRRYMQGKRRRSAHAMTVIEMLVAVVLCALLFGFLFRSFRLQRLAGQAIGKLSAIQRFRVAERRIRSELELGTAVLWPPPEQGGAAATHPFLVFTGPNNVPRTLYLDRSQQLVLQSLEELVPGKKTIVLSTGITRLAVRHSFDGNVSCEIDAVWPEHGTVSTAISVALCNHFHGSKGAL